MSVSLALIWNEPYENIMTILKLKGLEVTGNQNRDRAEVAILYYNSPIPFEDKYWAGHPNFLNAMAKRGNLSGGLGLLSMPFREQLELIYSIADMVCNNIHDTILTTSYKIYEADLVKLKDAAEIQLTSHITDRNAEYAVVYAYNMAVAASRNPIYDVWGNNLALDPANKVYIEAYKRYEEAKKVHEDDRMKVSQLRRKHDAAQIWNDERLKGRNLPGSQELPDFLPGVAAAIEVAQKQAGCGIRKALTRIADKYIFYRDSRLNLDVIDVDVKTLDQVVPGVWRVLLTKELYAYYRADSRLDPVTMVNALLTINYDEMIPIARCFFLYQISKLIKTLPPDEGLSARLGVLNKKYACTSLYAPKSIITGLVPLTGNLGQEGGAGALTELITAYTDYVPTKEELDRALLAML